MFQWYKLSNRCYVYLSDVSSGNEAIQRLSESRWFTRGWTLQELLAPKEIVFLAQDWVTIGYKVNQKSHKTRLVSSVGDAEVDDLNTDNFLSYADLADKLSTITDIPVDFLIGKKGLWQACVAQRMFWASRRETTREEDRAYSLMGLFDINMPVLYGEGLEKAFTRLQHEIMRKTPDQSILLWYRADANSYRLLAESPDCFQNSGKVMSLGQGASLSVGGATNWSAFYMTNLGLRITLPVMNMRGCDNFGSGDSAQATLHCALCDDDGVPQKIGLNLLFLNNSLEGYPIFTCYRPRKWIYSAGTGRPTSIFLCGNDYTSVLAKEKILVSTNIDKVNQKLNSVQSRFLDILANEMGISCDELPDKKGFDELGLDSLMCLTFTGRIREELNLEILPSVFDAYPTIGAFKDYLAQFETLSRKENFNPTVTTPTVKLPRPMNITDNYPHRKASSVLLQGNYRRASKRIFMVPEASGSAISYTDINLLSPDWAVFGLNSPFMKTPEEYNCGVYGMAAKFIEEMKRRQPTGPYSLAGWSAGGIIAYEIVYQLTTAGEDVDNLIIIDACWSLTTDPLPKSLHAWFASVGLVGDDDVTKFPPWLLPHFAASITALSEYIAEPIPKEKSPKVVIVWCEDGVCKLPTDPRQGLYPTSNGHVQFLLDNRTEFGPNGWDEYLDVCMMQIRHVPGNHFSMMRGDLAKQLASFMREALL